MNRVFQWLMVIVPAICVALIVSTSRAWAQQAPAQAPTPAKGCNPCISRNFDNWTDADEQRVFAQGMRKCKAHPEQCDNTPDQRWPVQLKKDSTWEHKKGHSNECFSDANNPSRPTCIPGTWVANGGNPQRGQCYSDPKDPSNRRCVPLVPSPYD